MKHVILLRGVNLGAHNRLRMADLSRAMEDLGAREVVTLLQSGNAVFEAPSGGVAAFAPALEALLGERHQVRTPVVLRAGPEFLGVLGGNPFLAEGADPRHLYVAFLRDRPEPLAVQALDPERAPGEQFRVVGWEVYLHLPDGVARTKLTTAWMDRALRTVSTVRNWSTVQKLGALLGA